MNDENKNVKSFNRRKVIKGNLLALLVLVVVFAGFKTYGYYDNKSAASTAGGPSSEQLNQAADVDSDNKKAFIDSNTGTDDGTNEDTTPAANAAISLSAKQEENGSVTVTTKLPGVSSGTCSLVATNGVKTSNQTAVVIYQPEFSTCAGFSIPQSALGSGTWKIDLKLSGSTTASASTTIEVN